jgi:hypothetical protein
MSVCCASVRWYFLTASGVIYEFVNGVLVLQNEEMTGNAPGAYFSLIKETNKAL